MRRNLVWVVFKYSAARRSNGGSKHIDVSVNAAERGIKRIEQISCSMRKEDEEQGRRRKTIFHDDDGMCVFVAVLSDGHHITMFSAHWRATSVFSDLHFN